MVRKHYHDRGWQSPFRRYDDLLAEVLTPSSTVLDVGCGRDFPLASHLLRHAGSVYGLDPAAASTGECAGAMLTSGEAERLPFPDAAFDVLCSQSVLEHLVEPKRAFAEFRRVLKPGGRVVFLTAGRYDYVSVGAMLIPNALHGRVVRVLEGRDESDTFATCYRANSCRQIRRIARDVGLAVERLEYLNQFPQMLMFSPVLCRLGIAYDTLIRKVKGFHWLQAWLLGSLVATTRPLAPQAQETRG